MPYPAGGVTRRHFLIRVTCSCAQATNRVLEDLFAFKDDRDECDNRRRKRSGCGGDGSRQLLSIDCACGRSWGGRFIPSDDAEPGQGAVAVISDGFWERDFGRSPSVLGQVIKLNEVPLTVIGVNPRDLPAPRACSSRRICFCRWRCSR